MPVYVDEARHRFGRMVMCHLWADSLDELLQMADAIGVARKWLQGHPALSRGAARDASWVHFDICLSKKRLAIAAGAILTDKYEPLAYVARLDIASGDPARAAAGESRLRQIARCRRVDAAGEAQKR